ncbi:MAG: hypothetical protein LLF98_02020 [Clostridium sp.]|uniref:hypothetical protein n=1 Tax=Clostridium sp. TaxID=1506 RepID=UPI0025BB007D|nr:hypothetical protein [Clostridium sp.]MCE5220058.1 hypothetical protein [Clostridium sp.]
MYVRLCGDSPIFAIGIFTTTNNNLYAIKELLKFSIANNNIAIFEEYEYNLVLNILNNNNISFSYTELDYLNYKEKTKDIKFNSRTELLKYLQEDVEPESQIISNLKNENTNLKLQLQQTEDVLLTLMFNNS